MEQIMEEWMTKIDAHFEKMMATMDSYYDRMRAIIKEYLGTTETFLERKGSAPEETEAVEKSQEVPEGATDEETIGAAKGRSRDLRLAVGCRGQLKMRTKRDGRFRQECAATVGRPTRRTVLAMGKGKLRSGPGKKCRSGIQGQSKAFQNGKRGRIGKRERRLEGEKTHREATRQSLRLEIARLMVVVVVVSVII
jgi:hypothetical protein